MAKTKKRYVQLIERYANGRIAKNEQYTVEEFISRLDCIRFENIELTWFDKVFKTKKYITAVEQDAFIEGVQYQRAIVKNVINTLIDSDSFGKKKK